MTFEYFDPQERIREKQAARDQYYALLRSGKVTLAEMNAKNSLFRASLVSREDKLDFPDDEQLEDWGIDLN